MSESVVDESPFAEDHEYPPLKKIKLQLDPETGAVLRKSSVSNETSDNNPIKSSEELDPVKEEEEERPHKGKNNNIIEEEDSEEDLVSLHDSSSAAESEEEENGESLVTNKKKTPKTKSKGGGGKKKKKNKSASMRRNIKDILSTDQLEDETLAARKAEEERIMRLHQKQQQLKAQQLKLLQLQHQQSQLLRESLNAPVIDTYPRSSEYPADDLMRRLIQQKHITVALDQRGVPQVQPQQQQSILNIRKEKVDDDDCILLSSDEEGETLPKSMSFPSHNALVDSLLADKQAQVKRYFSGGNTSGLASKEVIALSSGEEDNGDKEVNLFEGIGGRMMMGAGEQSTGVESDDDCVIINPDQDGEEEAEDKDECSQDLLNVPDHLGRVLVNVGHPEDEEDIFLPPQIAKIVKPHQIGGIRFLYDNVVESTNRFNETQGFGCILAHAMGLGKTLQTVSFCDVLLRTVGKTVLIIVPINTIQNWLNEFNRYLPARKNSLQELYDNSSRKRCPKSKSSKKDESTEENLQNGTAKVPEGTTEELASKFEEATALEDDTNSSSIPPPPTHSDSSKTEDNVQYRTFEVLLLNETVKSLQARERAIMNWATNGGVLLIGYEMYRMLALKKLKKSTRKAMTLDHEERVAEAESLDKIYRCLVDPGPDCVICDEGHRIKNSGAGISQALKAIKTKRRVVLTGYPLQNNLMEYWCMVDFVRPNYLGTKAEFSNMFERPIQNGQCADSTYEDKRLMKYRSHVLHSLLEGFVQRRSHVVLKQALPHKEEYVFLVRLTPVQLRIYQAFIKYLRDDLESDNASANPIKAFAVCCKIWNHPDVLYNVVKKNLDLEMDLDIDEVGPNVTSARQNKAKRGTGRPRGRPPLNGFSTPSPCGYGMQGENSDLFDNGGLLSSLDAPTPKSETSGISLEWAKPLYENYNPEVMEHGVKFELLFELIDETVAARDKLLVFSQSLLTLDLIEVFLKKRLDWRKFREYVRLDGSTAGLEREKLINEFNTSTSQKLFLISTRAGSLGINLVGANRVCIFDASWNPCHDSQAVCRVYRYGQTKPCHIYRFVADCTLEKRIYDRQVNKKGMADRIVDEMNPNTPFKSKDVSSFLVLQHDLLEKLPYIRCDVNMDKFPDPVMKNVLRRIGQKITQEPFEHESLLIDQKHQRLSKSEKRLALKNYEKEKQTAANATVAYSRPSYAQYYSAINASMSSSSSSYSSYTGGSSTQYRSSYSSSYSKSISSSLRTSAMDAFGSGGGGGSMGNSSYDRFELHINALKSRGISVFPVQLHQDTFLNDPSGASDIYVRAGERVYILVSQKGTYLRIQGKLLRVPFVGTEMTQQQAETFVLSLLQQPSDSGGSSGSGSSRPHPDLFPPAEQQLPPSSNIFSMKNANHLQITNSRNTSGGDVMVSPSWSTSTSTTGDGGAGITTTTSSSSSKKDQTSALMSGLPSMHSSTDASMNLFSEAYSAALSQSPLNLMNSSGSELQSLSKLADAFGLQPGRYSETSGGGNKQQWFPPSSPSSSTSKYNEPVASPSPRSDLEVIKLNRLHSSSNSNSSNSSRTNSPYTRQPWSNSPSDLIGGGASAYSKDPSFYTDFTITPLSRSNAPSPSSSSNHGRHSSSAHHTPTPPTTDPAGNYWNGNNGVGRGITTPSTTSANSASFYRTSSSSSSALVDALQQQSRSAEASSPSPSFGFGHSDPFDVTKLQLGEDLSSILFSAAENGLMSMMGDAQQPTNLSTTAANQF